MEDTLGGTQFSPVQRREFDGKRWIAVVAIVLGVVLVVGAGVFFLKGRMGGGGGSPTPTPTPSFVQPTNSPTPEPTPSVSRSEVSIKVLNGTGIKGEGAKLVATLKSLGYTKVEAGNASETNYETAEVSFASNFPGVYKREIMGKLGSEFKAVKETSESTGKVDVVITTGLRPGQSLPEEASPTPTGKEISGTVTPTKSVTVTPSPTVTVTTTPTPTP